MLIGKQRSSSSFRLTPDRGVVGIFSEQDGPRPNRIRPTHVRSPPKQLRLICRQFGWPDSSCELRNIVNVNG